MSIGLIEITFKLSGAEFSSLMINNDVLDLSMLDHTQPNYWRTTYYIPGTRFSVTLDIKGNTGNEAAISIRQLSNERYAREVLPILHSRRAQRTFSFEAADFRHTEHAEGLRFREGIGNGEDERGLVVPQKLPNCELSVWYATNRSKLWNDERVLEYGNEAGHLSLGRCIVNIPGERKVGELNRPSWWRLEFTENLNKHFAVLETRPLDEEEFLLGMLSQMSDSSDHDAFIFIHGFNTSFKAGILRTAQLAFDLGFKGAPIFYSWPSFGDVLNYSEDEVAIANSTGQFLTFLKMLEPVIASKKVHIIAHSMGNRLITAAINKLRETAFFQRASFNQLILAAPDIDANNFLNDYASKLPGTAKRITLYASSADTALKVSRNIHSSIIRLGESGQYITCFNGMDTVDATKTDPTFMGHGYYSNTAQLIGDIFQLFKFNFNPEFRNLVPHTEATELYWAFR